MQTCVSTTQNSIHCQTSVTWQQQVESLQQKSWDGPQQQSYQSEILEVVVFVFPFFEILLFFIAQFLHPKSNNSP